MSERKRRALEAGKSLLLVLLSLLAVVLSAKIFTGSQTERGLVLTAELLGAGDQTAGSTGVSRPVRMTVMNGSGRCGAQYDTAGVDSLFDSLGDLLGEALGSAGEAVPARREDWEAALGRTGVFYEFPGEVSLKQLSAWLGDGESALTGRVSALVLAREDGEDRVSLYCAAAGEGGYYVCSTAVRFLQRLEEYVPNGAQFAFEVPEQYGGLHPDTLILPKVPQPPIYQAGAVELSGEGEGLETLLHDLSFSPQPSSIYPAADGWNVRDGGDSLRLTVDGVIYYHAGEGSNRYLLAEDAAEEALLQAAGEIVDLVLAPNCGEARVYLAGMVQEGEEWILTYRYLLSGAEVKVGREGWCARFVVRGGQIQEYVLQLRHYESTGQTATLLPEYQAMHAMRALDANGKRLLLRYYDGGERMEPTWIAR